MRFHPKRRASIDQRPGPNIARAAAAVPNSSHTHLSPATVSIFQISINAMEVPTIGVHKPTISSIPAPIKSTAGIVTFMRWWIAPQPQARAHNQCGANDHAHEKQTCAGPTASECGIQPSQ